MAQSLASSGHLSLRSVVGHECIDEINILQATYKGMKEVVEGLKRESHPILHV